MAYNKIIYKGDVIMDITDSTVTPETLSEGVIAYGANGERMVGTNTGGAEVKLGELKISKNGEYEAPGSDAPSGGGTEVFNSTTPYAIDLGEEGGFWKSTAPVPTDIEAFINSSTVQVADLNGSVLGEMLFADLEWHFEEGVVAMCQEPGMFIIYDPATFESLMGVSLGFEQGLYILDSGMAAQGMQLIITTPGGAGVDGYNKVIVNVPSGGLDWKVTPSSIQYAITNGDCIIAGTGEMPTGLLKEQNIKRVFIMNSITSIGKSAFAYCHSLTHIIIPDSVTSIDPMAFTSCGNLTSIVIPDSVTAIGFSAFQFCRSLASITIPNSVTSIGESAFKGCSSLTSIVIPGSLTNLGFYMFENCTSLISVVVSDGVPYIQTKMFKGCTSLTSIEIPNSVTEIAQNAFEDCSNLTSVAVPNRVTHINPYAFSGCSRLPSITIPDSITYIGYNAFEDCTSLNNITYSGTIAQWRTVSKKDDWNRNVPATHVQCSDGQVAL